MKITMALFCSFLLLAAGLGAAESRPKNWTPPPYKINAQTLSEQIMAAHPELISVTFHGVPPGQKDVYTMFAGSYVDRIGNPDDDDDIMVSKLGITIVDPRWHRHDAVKKFVMMMPLRDQSGETIGLLVLAYHADPNKGERDYFQAASDLRDGLEKQIPSYAALYERADKS